MPDQIDTPTGLGAIHDWWPAGPGGSSHVQAVQSDDGDNSFIYRESGGAVRPIRYTFPPILGTTDPVSAAALTATIRWWNGPIGPDGELRLIWNSVQGAMNWHEYLAFQRPNYISIVDNMAAGQLALSAVNGEHGLYLRGSTATNGKLEYWCTHIYRTVTFSYLTGSAGSFSYLIGSLVGTLIGSGLLLREMPRLSAYMRRKHRKWLRPEEYEAAWLDWRAQKHMRMA